MENKTNIKNEKRLGTAINYKAKLLDILTNSVDQENEDKYLRLFDIYQDRHGNFDMAPISPMDIETSKNKVTLSCELVGHLDDIRQITIEEGREISFLLHGAKNPDNGNIYLGEIDLIGMGSTNSAPFSDKQKNELTSKAKEYRDSASEWKNDGMVPVICHGHSHPNSTTQCNCLSVSDLEAYIKFQDICDEFAGDNVIDVIGILVAPCGDYNVVEYDSVSDKLYKFEALFKDDGTYLPAYENEINYIAK